MSKNDLKLIMRGVGIKMSWVEKYRKINNRGDDYSRLESTYSADTLIHKKFCLKFTIVVIC